MWHRKAYMEKITLCGDNCSECPRYLANDDEKLAEVAELWYRIGWRDNIVSNQDIICNGCSSHKECTYHLVECLKDNGIEKCNQCLKFPCNKIDDMLKRSLEYENRCKAVCSQEEYRILKKAFFNKEENLNKK